MISLTAEVERLRARINELEAACVIVNHEYTNMEADIARLRAQVRIMVTREKYNEALFAAASASGDRERLLGLLHHIEEEIEEVELDSGTPGA